MRNIGRRTVLKLGLYAGASSIGVGFLACAPAAPSSTSAGGGGTSTAGLKLPTHVPFQGVRPDLPATPEGVDPGFFSVPVNLAKSVTETVGRGEEVTGLLWLANQGGIQPVTNNPAWQALNKAMNVNLKLTPILFSDYQAKLNAIIAGSDLPDTMWAVERYVRNAPDFMKAQCADLTPYLSGDSIKQYPNLANYPARAWRGAIYNGGIAAVPIARGLFDPAQTFIRGDLWNQAGYTHPANADDYKRILKDFTNPSAGRYGIGSGATFYFGLVAQSPVLMAFGAPNLWRIESNGTLVKDYETLEFKAAVLWVKELFDSGVYFPDTNSISALQIQNHMLAGRVLVYHNTMGAYVNLWDQASREGKQVELDLLNPWSHDGAKTQFPHGPNSFSYTSIKKADPDRIKLILRILNFLAAPFGSEEWALVTYGERGVDYTIGENNVPQLTDTGKADHIDWKYLAPPAPVLFNATDTHRWASTVHAHHVVESKVGVDDPTFGLYSSTYSNNAVTFNQAFTEGFADIIAGRRPVSDWDALVQAWRDQGGEQSRQEFQNARANAPKLT